jgi:hypothetical protein
MDIMDDRARSGDAALGDVLVAAEDLGLTPERQRFLAPRLQALLAASSMSSSRGPWGPR